MKPVPRRKISEWVLQVWENLSKEMIINSMKSCALGLAVDGSKDEKISCFHEGKKSSLASTVVSEIISFQTAVSSIATIL